LSTSAQIAWNIQKTLITKRWLPENVVIFEYRKTVNVVILKEYYWTNTLGNIVVLAHLAACR
jgi:hypothetical protein